MPRQHTDQSYEAELRGLRETLLSMAGQVEAMIAASIEALTERDPELAARTIELDHAVNGSEMEADQRCLELLARRQPMASDLRLITRAMKMVTDLERIGDLAVNICERAIDLSKAPPLAPFVDIPRMATIAQEMIQGAIEAFVADDPKRAREVIAQDDELDDLYHAVFRHLFELMADQPDALARGIHIQSVAKYLERMGDHATNLAEQVIFMSGGKDIRHEGKLDD